jgi:hypothetical protein
MYEELVKALKQCADASCNGCKNELVQIGCRGKLQREAADAIEKLEASLILMVLQYCTDEDGTLWHQFMCAGEGAFYALGITLKTNPQVLWDRLEKLEAKKKQRRKADD